MSNVVDALQSFLTLTAPYYRITIILLAILGLWPRCGALVFCRRHA